MNNSRLKALEAMVNRGSYASKAGSKGEALAYFKAKMGKKKLPTLHVKQSQKNPEYAKLSISEYEKKYG